MADATKIVDASVSLDRDLFMRTLIRELAGTLQDVVGIDDASGYISVVGDTIGSGINTEYRRALNVDYLNRQEVGQVLVDLKRRIAGDFSVVEESDQRLVLRNRACPFGDKVLGRPSMCMMTSNVFGHIAAQNLGYAKVDLVRTIASGHSECLVIIYLQATEGSNGREYFRSS